MSSAQGVDHRVGAPIPRSLCQHVNMCLCQTPCACCLCAFPFMWLLLTWKFKLTKNIWMTNFTMKGQFYFFFLLLFVLHNPVLAKFRIDFKDHGFSVTTDILFWLLCFSSQSQLWERSRSYSCLNMKMWSTWLRSAEPKVGPKNMNLLTINFSWFNFLALH